MGFERKGFNFYRSYFDVYQELQKDSDKVAFINALLQKQFNGVDPINLKGMAKFAYISQQHSVNQQVKGWEDKTGITLSDPPCEGGYEGGTIPPSEQLQGKGEVQEKEKEKEEKTIPPKLEWVIDYIKKYLSENPKKKFDSTPEKWYDFYQSKNWMIGKNKMKDWQAAIRTWMKDDEKQIPAKPSFDTNR